MFCHRPLCSFSSSSFAPSSEYRDGQVTGQRQPIPRAAEAAITAMRSRPEARRSPPCAWRVPGNGAGRDLVPGGGCTDESRLSTPLVRWPFSAPADDGETPRALSGGRRRQRWAVERQSARKAGQEMKVN